jgi:hypothetical protein
VAKLVLRVLFPEAMSDGYEIGRDYDPDGDMSADADPVTKYLTYVSHVHVGAVGDMGFTHGTASRSAAVALDPTKLHLNQSLSFAFSLDFHPAPSEPALQCPQRQIMLLTKFAPPQSTGFEFCHQPSDLLAASPFPNANLSDFHHADSASTNMPRPLDSLL